MRVQVRCQIKLFSNQLISKAKKDKWIPENHQCRQKRQEVKLSKSSVGCDLGALGK